MSEDRLADVRSRKIGFIFQSFHLIPSLTAFENILIPMEILGLRAARERAEQLLMDVDLTDRRTPLSGRALGRRAAKGCDRPRLCQ